MATLKPTAPLLAPNKGPLKPVAPLRPKTAPKTPISHPQRRWRFHSHTDTSEQRRSRFQTTGTPDRQGLAGRRADAPATRQHVRLHWCGGCRRAWRPGCGARGRWRGLAGQHTDTPTDWRPPRGLRGLAGQRGDVPNRRTATRPTGVEGAGGAVGPGCGARGRWQGLAGLRADAPSEARCADGERAGRRPRAHRAARPRTPAPVIPAGPRGKPGIKTQQTTRGPKRRSASGPSRVSGS